MCSWPEKLPKLWSSVTSGKLVTNYVLNPVSDVFSNSVFKTTGQRKQLLSVRFCLFWLSTILPPPHPTPQPSVHIAPAHPTLTSYPDPFFKTAMHSFPGNTQTVNQTHVQCIPRAKRDWHNNILNCANLKRVHTNNVLGSEDRRRELNIIMASTSGGTDQLLCSQIIQGNELMRSGETAALATSITQIIWVCYRICTPFFMDLFLFFGNLFSHLGTKLKHI